jgi:hypothetical protein
MAERRLCDVCGMRPAVVKVRRIVPGGHREPSTSARSMRHRQGAVTRILGAEVCSTTSSPGSPTLPKDLQGLLRAG